MTSRARPWKCPLFVRTVSHRSTRGAGGRLEHRLCAAMRDGTEVVLAGHIELLAQALFLERKIEAHLGIADELPYS